MPPNSPSLSRNSTAATRTVWEALGGQIALAKLLPAVGDGVHDQDRALLFGLCYRDLEVSEGAGVHDHELQARPLEELASPRRAVLGIEEEDRRFADPECESGG